MEKKTLDINKVRNMKVIQNLIVELFYLIIFAVS